MGISTASPKLTGVVPAVCDAEAGQQHSSKSGIIQANTSTDFGSSIGFSVRKGRTGLEPSRKPQRHVAHIAMD